MANDHKKGFKWRGLATFMLVLGILVEIVSGVILYITPMGRFANWNNWTLWGLDKHEWAAIHTVFGYLLLIVIGLHLYFNWRVVVHFFWNKLHSSFNLKREFIVASAIVVLVFAGTIWNIPPFSSVMDLGRDAKLSWEKNSDLAANPGGYWAQSTHGESELLTSRRGGGRWTTPQAYPAGNDIMQSENRGGRGRSSQFYNEQHNNNEQAAGRGQGRGQMLNPYDPIRPEARADVRPQSSETLKGRDFVGMGKPETLTGELVQKGDEWELKVGETLYEIHMGPSGYRNTRGLVLVDGAQAIVSGYLYGTDLSVTTIETGGKSVVLRDEAGRPAWAGSSFSRGGGRI
ncbi:MAG: DUF4405 domain-containing protein [Deltaproteobacteria bacterium]|nr:DUF4405 domain-containing protein [Deltaproteobacteria bacterium]